MTDEKRDHKQEFVRLVDVIEDAGFEVVHERFKSDREDSEFKAVFWIRSDDS